MVLNVTPDQALLILQAAQQQGIADDVRAWGCSTPCNSDFVAAALGIVWDGKFGGGAELIHLAVESAKLAFGLGSFSQMGFVEARIATAALLNMRPPYTLRRVNQAFAGITNGIRSTT